MEVVQSFYDYTERWSLGTGPLKRTSLQLFGIFIDARVDFLKKGDVASSLIARLYEFVDDHSNNDEWEIQYFAVLCFEKLCNSSFGSLVESNMDVRAAIVECLANPHPWIKRVASRMIGTLLNSLEAETFASNKSLFLVDRPGMLYQVARNLCSHLDLDEDEQNEELTATAIKSLVWIVQAMHHFPESYVMPTQGWTTTTTRIVIQLHGSWPDCPILQSQRAISVARTSSSVLLPLCLSEARILSCHTSNLFSNLYTVPLPSRTR